MKKSTLKVMCIIHLSLFCFIKPCFAQDFEYMGKRCYSNPNYDTVHWCLGWTTDLKTAFSPEEFVIGDTIDMYFNCPEEMEDKALVNAPLLKSISNYVLSYTTNPMNPSGFCKIIPAMAGTPIPKIALSGATLLSNNRFNDKSDIESRTVSHLKIILTSATASCKVSWETQRHCLGTSPGEPDCTGIDYKIYNFFYREIKLKGIERELIIATKINGSEKILEKRKLSNKLEKGDTESAKIATEGSENITFFTIKGSAKDINLRFKKDRNEDLDGKIMPISSTDMEAKFAYTHPKYLPEDAEDFIDFEVEETDKSVKNSFRLQLVPPPILLIHGLGGDGNGTWGSFVSFLKGKKNYQNTLIVNPNFPPCSSFNPTFTQVKTEIDKLLTNALSGKISAKKVDISGHSMGGILARYHINEKGNENVNRLITCNTPHWGSSLAGALHVMLSGSGNDSDTIPFLGCLPSSKGALVDLNLKSTALWDMYANQKQTVPTHAIFTLQNIPQECNEGEIKPFDLDGFMTPLINCVTDWEVIKNSKEGHDYVVHVRSQKGGLQAPNTSGFPDIIHSGSVSKTPIMNRLYELLQKKTDDPVFYNGKFPKPDTDFFFAPNNNDEKEKTSVATLAFDSSLKNKIVKKGQTIPVKITKSSDLATVVFYSFTTQSDSITFGYSKSQNPVFNYTIRPDFDEKIKLVAIAKQGNDYISDTTFLIVQADETLNFLPTFKPNPIASNNAIEAKNGHFYNKNNEKIRFWGINIGETAAFPSKAQADKTAKELREKGFNLVRFHAIDNLQGNDSTTLFFGTQETTRKINLAQLDKLHYFVAALKKEGIYSNINLKTARVFFEKDGIVGADSLFKYGKLGMNYGKGICLFDVQMQDFQKEFAQQVLAPVNPYTGVSLAADPTVAMIELNNEDNIYNYFKTNNLKSFAEGGSLLWRQKKALDALWYEFLKNKYPTNQALAAAWSNGANAFSPVELIENGCFEEKTLGNTWVLEVNAGTATAVLDSINSFAGKKSLRLNIPIAPTQNWHIQMKNYGFSLKKDSVYTIFFAAKADQTKTIRAEVSNNIAPYNSYQGFDVALTNQWKTYQFTFKATENNVSNARFAFLTNMQAGTFWFDNVSFLPKNAPAPLPNPELVSNGNFEMSSTNWSLEKNDAAINANFSTTTTAPFEKTTSGQLAVTQASNQYWHIQLKNTGFSLQKDSIYEVVFAAKANTNATLQANASLNIAPFTWFGGQTFNVGTQWQTFSFRFKAKENVSMQGKFAFSMIQNATFWFDAVSVRKISVKGLSSGENLWCDNIKRHDFSERYQISENRLGDLTDFYMQLQKNHFDKLYAFLKNNLGVKAMITGTNELLGVQNLRHQTNMDFIDDHSYWDLPNFPVKGFDPVNWSIKNQSMLKSENMEGITNLFSGLKLSTKPYTVSEYNHCAPNIYRTEMMPILTAYGSLHDCDAMILYSYSNNYSNEKGAVKNWFFLQNDRSILNQSPVAAMVYRNQLLKADNQPLTIQYSSDFFRKSAKIYETDNFDYPKYYNPRIALQRNVTVKGVSEATTTNFSTIPNLTTDKITTITNETTLDKTQGILQTVSSKYISIAGFLNNAPNTKVGDLELVNANDFGVITWAALADSSLKNSEKSLLTIVTRQENTGMGWNATKTSLGNNWGNTPLVFPPMKTTLNLSINADTLYVYPLDDKGNAQKGVKYLPGAAKIFTINIDQSQNYTTWYGLKALKKAINPIFPLGLKPCLEDDFLTLKKIYDTNNGAAWKDKSNWLTNPDMTKWKGVTLTSDGCDVQTLNLRNNNLSGELPAIDLPKLTQFIADSNKLSGKIPLINAPNLETIYLYDNQLTGTIPNLNLPKLRYLWLSRNPLSGKIPDFDAMPNLEDLRLRNCNLEGNVPNFSKTQLNNSSSLLWLSGNKFVFGDFENKSWLSLNELRYSNQQKIPLTKNGNTLSVATGSQNAIQKFEWYKNGQLLTTNQSNTFNVTSNGKYHCKITHNTLTIANNVEKNLILETEAVDVNTVATQEEILTGIKIYPNPTNGLLFVEIDNQLLTKITLLDINGRLLLQKNISQQGSLDLKQFSKGIYVLKLEMEGKVLFRKVLVE